MPYTPSFVLPLSEVDDTIRNVRDVVFLPNFQKPTMAVLCESDVQTWTSSLMVHRDTLHLYIFTLDLSSTTHPVLSHVENIPYDAMYLKACSSLGGVFVVTPTNLIHVDQNGRMVGLRVNSWTERVTTNEGVLGFPEWTWASDRDKSLDLCNSHLLWTEDIGIPVTRSERRAETTKPPAGSGLLLLHDGRVFNLSCTVDGRSISGIHLDSAEPSSESDRLRIPPSCAVAIPQHNEIPRAGAQVFVGSMLGSSRLLSLTATATQEMIPDSNGSAAPANDMDLDDDADLYGDSTASSTLATSAAAKSFTRLVYAYSTCDLLPTVGPLSDATLAVIQDHEHNDVVKTIATHGVAPEGGFVHLETEIQPRNQKVLWSDGQSSRVWSVGADVFVSQQQDQAQPEAFVFTITESCEPEQLAVFQGKIIDVKRLSHRYFVVAFSDKLATFDLEQIQSGPVHTTGSDSKDTSFTSISAFEPCQRGDSPAALAVLTSEGQVRLFQGDGNGALTKIEHSITSRCIAAHLFVDPSGATESLQTGNAPQASATSYQTNSATAATTTLANDDEVDYGDEIDDVPATHSARGGLPNGSAHRENFSSDSRKLALITIEGSVELHSISLSSSPNLTRFWKSNTVLDLPERLDSLKDSQNVVVCSEVSADSVHSSWIGTLGDKLAIALAESDGLLTVWTASRVASSNGSSELSFIKAFTKVTSPLDASVDDATLVPPNGEPQKPSDVALVPIDLRDTLQDPFASGLFLTGRKSGWLIKTRRGGLNFHPSSVGDTASLTVRTGKTGEDWSGKLTSPLQYLYSTNQGLMMADFPRLDYELPIARTHYSSGRDYTHVRPYPATRCLIAASTVNTPFVLFDTEEGEVIRDLNVDPTFSLSKRGSLELFKHDWNEPIDGYELDQNETVTALELLTLTSAGSLTGLREFVAVGTTVYNGEDRPTRGAMYIFEVVETVPDQAEPEMNCRLKLLVRDDAGKGPVTALADISGYLAVAVGQKLFIRAFENHEALTHVAFLDTYYLTTSIRRLGSTLLLSDLQKSITFVGFQEEPFKLTVFAHDYVESYSTTANFLLTEESLAFVSTDWKGSLRLLEYNPNTFNNSHYGSRLNLKTEFQTGTEWTCSTTLAGSDTDDHAGLAVSNEILLGGIDGSLASLRPVIGSAARGLTADAIFNTLNALQNQLARSVPHTAALNPRGHRIVRNEWQSRPMNKGVLDIAALRSWLEVGRPKMVEVAESLRLGGNVGTSSDEVREVLKALRSVL